jgi:uncharacterized metal-binding protein YceD (DUF177 family)
MHYLKQFRILFAGLKSGNHTYHFHIDKDFLSHYNIPEIDNINAELDFSLDKQTAVLTLNFELEGKVDTLGDRCGDELSLSIYFCQELLIKFGKEAGEESEKIIIIPSAETEIEISQYIYEFITFAIPLKKIHPEGKCNKESLKKLNDIKADTEKKENIDPRWQELAKLNLS